MEQANYTIQTLKDTKTTVRALTCHRLAQTNPKQLADAMNILLRFLFVGGCHEGCSQRHEEGIQKCED